MQIKQPCRDFQLIQIALLSGRLLHATPARPITKSPDVNMLPQPIAVLLLVLLCTTAARAVPAYERPMNGDCITMSGTTDLSTGVSLYPEQFMLVGDNATQGAFYTEASRLH